MNNQFSRQSSSKTIAPLYLDHIHSTKQSLHILIDQLSSQLHQHYELQQKNLIDSYKNEIIQAQKQFNEVKSKINEQEIKNKMIQKKKKLQKQRHDLIKTNMNYTQKCQEYKKRLSIIEQENSQLQNELIFLDDQINNAKMKKYQIFNQQDIKTIKTNKIIQGKYLPIFSDRKPSQTSTFKNKTYSQITKHPINYKKILIQSSLNTPLKQTFLNNKDNLLDNQKSKLQGIFENTVQQIKEKRKQKEAMPVLKGQEFTYHQKRAIMESFLSQEEVKRKLYEILFINEQKKVKMGSKAKIKISFEDIK